MLPYYDCSIYPSKTHSGHALMVIYYIIYHARLPLCVFPLSDGEKYVIAVIGTEIPQGNKDRIREALCSGEKIQLPPLVLADLAERFRSEKGVTIAVRGCQ